MSTNSSSSSSSSSSASGSAGSSGSVPSRSSSANISTLSMSTRDAILARTGRVNVGGGEKDFQGNWQSQRLRTPQDKPLVGEVFETPDQEDANTTNTAAAAAAAAHADKQHQSQQATDSSHAASAAGSTVNVNGTGHPNSEDVIRAQMKPALAFQKFAGDVYQIQNATHSQHAQTFPFFHHRQAQSPSHPSTTSTWENVVSHNPVQTNQTSSQLLAQALNRRFEHPVARLQRLAFELNEFESDLHALLEEEALQPQQGEASTQLAQQLGQQVKALQQQLNNITVDKKFKPLFPSNQHNDTLSTENKELVSTAPQVFVTPQPTSTLEQFLQQLNAQEANISHTQTHTHTHTHMQHHTAHTEEKVQVLALLPEFEGRLNQLEKLVGLQNKDTPILLAKTQSNNTTQTTNNNNTAATTANNAHAQNNTTGNANTNNSTTPSPLLPLPLSVGLSYPDVVTGLRALHHSILALSPSRIEFLSRKLRTLLTDADHIIEKENETKPSISALTASASADNSSNAANLSSSSYASLVLHVASVIERWDHLSLSLPLIIERLSALKVLHESSALALGKVSQIETDHATLVAQQQQQAVALTTLQESLRTNSATLKENFSSLENRLAKVQEKLNKLS